MLWIMLINASLGLRHYDVMLLSQYLRKVVAMKSSPGVDTVFLRSNTSNDTKRVTKDLRKKS